MKHYQRTIEKKLRELGANSSYIGFAYIVYGVESTMTESTVLTYICKGLYVDIALRYQTSMGCVERNIRTVIDKIWEEGNRDALNEVFGRKLLKKPKNAEFFDALAEFVKTKELDYDCSA